MMPSCEATVAFIAQNFCLFEPIDIEYYYEQHVYLFLISIGADKRIIFMIYVSLQKNKCKTTMVCVNFK